MPFATSLFEHGTVVGPSAATCSNAASRSAGRIGAVLAELQVGSVFTQLLAPVGAAQPVLQRLHHSGSACSMTDYVFIECLTAASAYA